MQTRPDMQVGVGERRAQAVDGRQSHHGISDATGLDDCDAARLAQHY
jgi:hypothetical protein